MKRIEITTAQKVTIQYDLATLRERILAYSVDMIILGTILLVLILIITYIAIGNLELYLTLSILLLSPVFLFYTLASEAWMNGQTFGKRAMGLKVVKLGGDIPSIDDLLIRWVFRWIDIYTSFGAVAALLISAGDKSQRLGDLLSNTAVVKLKGSYDIRLIDLEHMLSAANYEPRFPGVTVFSEEDMLGIKELIARYARANNEAHRALVDETAQVIAHRLQLAEVPVERFEFLKTILKEYVMLTR